MKIFSIILMLFLLGGYVKSLNPWDPKNFSQKGPIKDWYKHFGGEIIWQDTDCSDSLCFWGPYGQHYNDKQCRELKTVNDIALNLCKRHCLFTPGCDTIAWNPRVSCVLRTCGNPPPHPEDDHEHWETWTLRPITNPVPGPKCPSKACYRGDFPTHLLSSTNPRVGWEYCGGLRTSDPCSCNSDPHCYWSCDKCQGAKDQKKICNKRGSIWDRKAHKICEPVGNAKVNYPL